MNFFDKGYIHPWKSGFGMGPPYYLIRWDQKSKHHIAEMLNEHPEFNSRNQRPSTVLLQIGIHVAQGKRPYIGIFYRPGTEEFPYLLGADNRFYCVSEKRPGMKLIPTAIFSDKLDILLQYLTAGQGEINESPSMILAWPK
jgi:hypothetical protein